MADPRQRHAASVCGPHCSLTAHCCPRFQCPVSERFPATCSPCTSSRNISHCSSLCNKHITTNHAVALEFHRRAANGICNAYLTLMCRETGVTCSYLKSKETPDSSIIWSQESDASSVNTQISQHFLQLSQSPNSDRSSPVMHGDDHSENFFNAIEIKRHACHRNETCESPASLSQSQRGRHSSVSVLCDDHTSTASFSFSSSPSLLCPSSSASSSIAWLPKMMFFTLFLISSAARLSAGNYDSSLAPVAISFNFLS